MYADPTQIRKNRVTLYLSDAEANLVEAINGYRGSQKSVLARELLIAACHSALAGDLDIGGNSQVSEGAQYALFQS